MAVLTTRTLLKPETLAPVPDSPGSMELFLWHPVEKALWLFVPSPSALWRVNADGTGTLLASGDAMGVPKNFPAQYLHGQSFYFDTARKAVVWLFSTYASGFGDGLWLGAWDGREFSPIKTKNGVRVASGDSFVFDRARGVLVHFAGQRDMDAKIEAERVARGGLTIRELGKDGTWRDVGKPLAGAGTYETHAGWDERRKLAVFIDNDTFETHGWDGRKWHVLGELPEAPWKPNTMTQAPRSKSLVYLQRQRSNTERNALLWELTDEGWSERAAGTLEAFGGAAHDFDRDQTFVLGPWLGPGTVQSTLGRYDGERIVLAGQPVPVFVGGSSSGPAIFWAAHEPSKLDFSRETRRPYSAAALLALTESTLAPLPPSPPSLGLTATAAGCLAVGFDGQVWQLAGGSWQRVVGPPKGFAERDNASLGADEEGRLLLAGGEPLTGMKHLTDAWLFDGKRWSEVPAKGPAPSAVRARITFDVARSTWILVGGQLKNYAPNPKTYEHDGKKWSNFPTAFDGGTLRPETVLLLTYDSPSATVFLVRWRSLVGGSLAVYRGEGVWKPVAKLELPADTSAVAYDTVRRVLVTAGPASLGEVEIGELLDAARGSTGSPVPQDKKLAAAQTAKAAKAPKAEEGIAPAVWLRVRDGGSDKFWFASRSGATWTARWGRRGAKASQKSYELATAALATSAYEKAVREKLGKGYEHAADKEDAARIPGRTAFRMKLGSKGDDSFGGIPAGVTAQSWPVCADCKHPMPHVLLLHADAERLPLEKHVAIALFACNGAFSSGGCETWEADGGCNAAIFLTASDLASKPLSSPPAGPGGEEAPKLMRARKIAYSPQFEADQEADDNPDDIEASSKVGGYPVWVQGDDTPTCSKCKQAMRFVAQIQEVDEALNFGGGDGYLFCCPHEHSAKFLWQQ